ncbi:MAG: hypothetical protein J6B86_01005 [Clostridia bacterium]|nr:hypothetical protein [Clostridia bacterium]
MTKLFLPLIVGFGGVWFVLRRVKDKATRRAGLFCVLLAAVCFFLYSYGFLGIGVSSLVLYLFEKAGIVL